MFPDVDNHLRKFTTLILIINYTEVISKIYYVYIF